MNLALTIGSYFGSGNGLLYNLRCLKWYLANSINGPFATATLVVRNTFNHDSIHNFQLTMQGIPSKGSFGIHGGSHLSMRGDPRKKTYSEPGDPIIYLHHSDIDRV